jgi:hypothetical protein
MQPCPTCGGMGIDANGYCTQCRTYRGLPQSPPPSSGAPYGGPPPSGPPYSGSPYSGAPYGAPASGPPAGAPYGGYPTSAGPGYPQPTSGGAPMAYPATTYGGAYGAPTTPPPKKRSSFMVPLIALSGVLAILVVAIVVVVLVKNSGSDSSDNTAAGGGTTTEDPKSALVDQCVVGVWQMTSYSEDVPVPNVGSVPFTLSGNGAKMTFGKDGKGIQDFGAGTNFVGNVTQAGTTVPVNLQLSGKVTYDFRTNDGVMSFSNMVSQGKATVSAGGQSQSQDYKGDTDPSKYICNGDKMTMSTSAYQSELKRVSTSG